MVGKSRVQKPCPPPLVPTDPPCPSRRAEELFYCWLLFLLSIQLACGFLTTTSKAGSLRTWGKEERDLPEVSARRWCPAKALEALLSSSPQKADLVKREACAGEPASGQGSYPCNTYVYM